MNIIFRAAGTSTRKQRVVFEILTRCSSLVRSASLFLTTLNGLGKRLKALREFLDDFSDSRREAAERLTALFDRAEKRA